MAEGWLWRNKQQQNLFAAFVSVPVINSGMARPKKGITAEQFLGRPFEDENKKEEPKGKEYYIDKFNIPDHQLSPELRKEKKEAN